MLRTCCNLTLRAAINRRAHYSTTAIQLFPLEEFRDVGTRPQRLAESVGRHWKAIELRRKSYDDLQKLWLVLYKERNMLLTEQQISRRRGLVFPQPERMTKVQKSMGAIRQVLGERKREKIAAHHSQKKALESMATVDNMELDSVSTSSSS